MGNYNYHRRIPAAARAAAHRHFDRMERMAAERTPAQATLPLTRTIDTLLRENTYSAVISAICADAEGADRVDSLLRRDLVKALLVAGNAARRVEKYLEEANREE
jgi:hypothetical protein